MSFLKKLLRGYKDRAIGRLPSRIFLEMVAIPALAAAGKRRMLFVGTRSYNQALYRRCRAEGISVWSVDLDPTAAPHGAPAGHFVGNICDIGALAHGMLFDVIVCNGVLGWGLDDPADAVRAFTAMKTVGAPGALVLVGWNPGRTSGAEVAAIQPLLTRTALGPIPEEIEFPPLGRAQRHPHRYELFALA